MTGSQAVGGNRKRLIEPSGEPEVDDLRERVLDLEARVRALAASRRVLITLLVSSDKRRKMEVAQLRAELDRQKDRNRRYSRALLTRRTVIHRLRFRLGETESQILRD